MLGSWAEAEDVVQDAWPRRTAVAGSGIAEPAAYLTTMVTRLAPPSTPLACAVNDTWARGCPSRSTRATTPRSARNAPRRSTLRPCSFSSG
nr:hypothetical protein [Microcella alkalica]